MRSIDCSPGRGDKRLLRGSGHTVGRRYPALGGQVFGRLIHHAGLATRTIGTLPVAMIRAPLGAFPVPLVGSTAGGLARSDAARFTAVKPAVIAAAAHPE
jgi:hypothetical protein